MNVLRMSLRILYPKFLCDCIGNAAMTTIRLKIKSTANRVTWVDEVFTNPIVPEVRISHSYAAFSSRSFAD